MNNCLRSMALASVLAIAVTALTSASTDARSAVLRPCASCGVDSAFGDLQQTWICDRCDNICGLDDPRMLSNPSVVDYDALLKATPEMKKIVNDKIDPNSSEGINLRQRAVDRIRDKTDAVRTAQGYCSTWKAIRHQDGRKIPDITDLVKAQL